MSTNPQLNSRLARVRELMQARNLDALVLRNNPDLRWLTGAERVFDDEQAHTAFITQDELYLHTDSRYLNSFVERMGRDSAWTMDMELVGHEAWVAARLEQSKVQRFAIEDSISLGFYDELLTQLEGSALELPPQRLHSDLCDLRMVKDDEELALLRRAQEITDETFIHMCNFIRPSMTEQRIRVELENYMLSHGADDISFSTIIAAGPNGANPHAIPGSYEVQRGDLIVMDYGALYCDYHADMTRTVCLGEPSKKQREVYEIVRRAHEECAAMVKAGVIGKEVHEHSVKVISDAGYGAYYGHGLGHGVGIEIHERPNLGRLYDKPLPLGSVVTVEPGIYLPGEFGIRLEDTGVVGEQGYEPFTKLGHELVCLDV